MDDGSLLPASACGRRARFRHASWPRVKRECGRGGMSQEATRSTRAPRRRRARGAAPARARALTPRGCASSPAICRACGDGRCCSGSRAARSWLPPALLAHGIVLVFLFAPLHEASIARPFAPLAQRSRGLGLRRAPDPAAGIFPRLPLHPPPPYPGPLRDPELATPKPARSADTSGTSGPAVLARAPRDDLRHACGRVEEPFIAPRARPRIVREARLLPRPLRAAGARLARRRSAACSVCGSGRRCSASRSCACPARRAHRLPAGAGDARNSRTTRSPPRCAGSRGTCPITPSTTPTRPCRSTPCPRRTGCSRRKSRCRRRAMSRCSARSSPDWPGRAVGASALARARAVMQSGVGGSSSRRSRPMSSPQRAQKPNSPSAMRSSAASMRVELDLPGGARSRPPSPAPAARPCATGGRRWSGRARPARLLMMRRGQLAQLLAARARPRSDGLEVDLGLPRRPISIARHPPLVAPPPEVGRSPRRRDRRPRGTTSTATGAEGASRGPSGRGT